MIKHYCDLCQKEITDDDLRKFYCIMKVRFVKSIVGFFKHQKQIQPQIAEKDYEFCQKCLSDKLPGFDG